ncbi:MULTISPECIES: nuclease-related domain-containing protein [unclassified Bacillus (in: firmicutes)]|uniref:nuclease-related domain-containing protein n=1 Tax=unclassified Bacillus (in: firmicutes) TaxID=185979 RepID=UPI0008E9E75B|nr:MULTISPECIES: nuclease-related domain-containing protein [unclassified Bacillus (in: firmicutes)]SFA79805.1 Nuclease-related domain-containing protein [Bacillus sp. UNCCL13]SFQ69861.1 Nuclease-related domain-containing protein [Bacillus sp. cl95]
MIVKSRGVPQIIQVLKALLPRLDKNHPKRNQLQQQLDRRLAGLRGEESLDYYLGYLDEQKYFILHDLRLANGPHFFQIDTLLLTTQFAVILEVKNIAGKIIFDLEAEQLIRTLDNEQQGFHDPLSQLEFQLSQLKKWLTEKKCPALPLEGFVVISSDRTIYSVSNQDKEAYRKICHAYAILKRLIRLEKFHNNEVMTLKEVQRMYKLLVKHHQPLTINVQKHLGVSTAEIRTGVQCPECEFLPMHYGYGYWHCEICHHKTKNAHLNVLKDYSLLITSTITNSEFRRFLHVPTLHMANHKLRSLQLPYIGEGKQRKYDITHIKHPD